MFIGGVVSKEREKSPSIMHQSKVLISVDDDERRLLLTGRTGVGKSRTGNIIFNESVFHSELSSSSVTRECQTHTDAVNNRRVTVIDTPDFIYSTNTHDDLKSQLKRALDLCTPGAHAILLLLSLNTFTQQEMDYVTWFEQTFGEEVLRYTIVLFIHVNKTHKRTIRGLIRKNNKLSDLMNRFGQRYLEFNIRDLSNRQQVSVLMEKIDTMVFNNTNTCYTTQMLLENERRAEERKTRAEERKTREKEQEEEEHLRDLERVRQETGQERKRRVEELEWSINNKALVSEDAEQLEEKKSVEENTPKDKENENLLTWLKRTCRQNSGYIFCGSLVLFSTWFCYKKEFKCRPIVFLRERFLLTVMCVEHYSTCHTHKVVNGRKVPSSLHV